MEYKDFEPFQMVLVWQGYRWVCAFFSHETDDWYYTTSGHRYSSSQIIPYKGNEHKLDLY